MSIFTETILEKKSLFTLVFLDEIEKIDQINKGSTDKNVIQIKKLIFLN